MPTNLQINGSSPCSNGCDSKGPSLSLSWHKQLHTYRTYSRRFPHRITQNRKGMMRRKKGEKKSLSYAYGKKSVRFHSPEKKGRENKEKKEKGKDLMITREGDFPPSFSFLKIEPSRLGALC